MHLKEPLNKMVWMLPCSLWSVFIQETLHKSSTVKVQLKCKQPVILWTWVFWVLTIVNKDLFESPKADLISNNANNVERPSAIMIGVRTLSTFYSLSYRLWQEEEKTWKRQQLFCLTPRASAVRKKNGPHLTVEILALTDHHVRHVRKPSDEAEFQPHNKQTKMDWKPTLDVKPLHSADRLCTA